MGSATTNSNVLVEDQTLPNPTTTLSLSRAPGAAIGPAPSGSTSSLSTLSVDTDRDFFGMLYMELAAEAMYAQAHPAYANVNAQAHATRASRREDRFRPLPSMDGVDLEWTGVQHPAYDEAAGGVDYRRELWSR